MTRTKILATIATLAVAAASPAIAKPGGGGGGGHGHGAAGAGPQGGLHGMGRINSQSTINASPRALERANINSGLSGEAVTGTRIRSSNGRLSASSNANLQLTGVTSGMTVVDSGGATVGTVTGVFTRGNGSIRSVQVTLTGGQVINLDPRSLSVDGGVLITSSLTSTLRSQGPANASITGLANASPNSVLAAAGITTLTGLTTGLTVDDIGGDEIGTVSEVILNRSGAVVGIRVDLEGGGSATIPAGSLSMDGTTVITTFDPTQ